VSGTKILRVFCGALGRLKAAGFNVNSRIYYAPEPVALVRQRPLSGRFSSVPVVKILPEQRPRFLIFFPVLC